MMSEELRANYAELMADVLKHLENAGKLAQFRAAMGMRQLLSAKDMVRVREPVDFGTLRGQISICEELAEADPARLASEAKAKADGAGRIPG